MGTLTHFNLPAVIERYRLRHFVETGTGSGESLAHAAQAPFETLHSIEISEPLYTAARSRFAHDKRITVHLGESVRVLNQILRVIPPDEPIMFWLDAHFAGADYGLADYGDDKNVRRRLPLQDEVAAIREARGDYARDVIFADDARIYHDSPWYQAGPLPPDFPGLKGLEERSLQFFRDAFGPTHGIVVDYAAQGFVMVCPRLRYEDVNRVG